MVAVAKNLTKDFQDTVTVYPWIGFDTYGGPSYGAGVPIPEAIIDDRQYLRTLPGGKEILQRASLTIPRPIVPNGAANRFEPLDTRDKIVLPSGYTGPILAVIGPNDPQTHAPFSFEVVLG
jgi:hypothetical protein